MPSSCAGPLPLRTPFITFHGARPNARRGHVYKRLAERFAVVVGPVVAFEQHTQGTPSSKKDDQQQQQQHQAAPGAGRSSSDSSSLCMHLRLLCSQASPPQFAVVSFSLASSWLPRPLNHSRTHTITPPHTQTPSCSAPSSIPCDGQREPFPNQSPCPVSSPRAEPPPLPSSLPPPPPAPSLTPPPPPRT